MDMLNAAGDMIRDMQKEVGICWGNAKLGGGGYDKYAKGCAKWGGGDAKGYGKWGGGYAKGYAK